MKPDYKPLKELSGGVTKYKTKVRVLHKGYPQKSPKKESRYQRLILEDDEGFTMKATLFNNDIEKYAEALQRKGEYELGDATIKKVDEEYASRPNECSLVINARAKILPLIDDPEKLAPEYQAISTIPRDPDANSIHDVLGVVLHVSQRREVERSTGRKATGRKDIVREVQIIDHSHDRPFSITLWNEIVDVHDSILNSWAESFNVVGFVAVTGKNFKGFTMASTMSTAIIVDPEGVRADALRAWAAKNKDRLIDHRSKLIELYSPTKKKALTKIEAVNQKKAHNTWQEEAFTIKAALPTISSEDMHLYLGCSKCNRKCDVSEVHTKFTCPYCAATDATAEPRVILKIEAVDDTGSLPLTVFAKDIEKLLGFTPLQLWTFTHNDDLTPVIEKMSGLRKENVLLTIGPALSLTTSNVLNWSLKSLEIETNASAEDGADAAGPSTSTNIASPDTTEDLPCSTPDYSVVPFSEQ